MTHVIEEAKVGFIFGCDGLNGYTGVINLQNHFKGQPFDIKLLDHKGVDITITGQPFISNVVFTDEHNKEHLKPEFYLMEDNRKVYKNRLYEIIKRDYGDRRWHTTSSWFIEKDMKTVNYYNPVNWALTYKMRGFDLDTKEYPKNYDLDDNYTASLIYKLVRDKMEYKPADDDESSNDTDTDEIRRNAEQNLKEEHIALFRHLRLDFTCVYVEYEPTEPEEINVRQRPLQPNILHPSRVFDIYNNGSHAPFGTIIEISHSPRLDDYIVHSDEGWYDAAVNHYNKERGIVLAGEQNSGVMYYGTAIDESTYIPDVFYERL